METFSEYLTGMRVRSGLSLRAMAGRLGVSPAYYNDLEKGRKHPPSVERLEAFVREAALSREEKDRLMDLAGLARNTVAPDVAEYVTGRAYVTAALRAARDRGAGKREWEAFTEQMRG